jgi:regulator of RNase E activity RraB
MTDDSLHFETPQQVLEHCNKNHMMAYDHVNGLGEVEYWVDVYHKQPYQPMICFYTESNLLGWANAYFNDPNRGSHWADEDSDDEDDETDL